MIFFVSLRKIALRFINITKMAHKKAGGSTNNGRDSVAKRLGVKVFGNQFVPAGGIIIRQRGTKFFPGKNTAMGKDHTIYATVSGIVKFREKRMKKFDGRTFRDKIVEVEPIEIMTPESAGVVTPEQAAKQEEEVAA